MLILVSANATAGKDTFYTLLKTHLSKHTVTRMAFADELRRELDPLFKSFGGTAWETDPIKKAAQRPVLVAHGMAQRIVSGGTHWIKALEPHVKAALDRGETVVITDCRFPNELTWGKELGGKCVYIERIREDGTIVPPVNADETEHDKTVRAAADVTISWPTEKDIYSLFPHVEKAARQLGLETK
jgi:hypothetical protein